MRSEDVSVNPITGRRIVDESLYFVEFKPRRKGRRLVGFITLATFGAAAYFGYQAYEERTVVAYGIAGTVLVLAAVLWAAWASSPVAHVHVHGGVLEVRRGGTTDRFDLTSHYTKIRTVGKPRSGRWKVLIDRPANDPFVIDRTMVNPREFTKVLEAYHHVG